MFFDVQARLQADFDEFTWWKLKARMVWVEFEQIWVM